MTTTIDETLRYRILEAPGEEFHVIVRTDEVPEEVEAQCQREGMQVHYRYHLLPGLALTGKGEAVLALADNPHVRRIEADREVRAK